MQLILALMYVTFSLVAQDYRSTKKGCTIKYNNYILEVADADLPKEIKGWKNAVDVVSSIGDGLELPDINIFFEIKQQLYLLDKWNFKGSYWSSTLDSRADLAGATKAII